MLGRSTVDTWCRATVVVIIDSKQDELLYFCHLNLCSTSLGYIHEIYEDSDCLPEDQLIC